MTSDDIRTITDAEVLKALASPIRTRLLDSLKVHGPATASTLAQLAQTAVGSASHHLRVLAEAGLIVEVPERARDGRERWWGLANRGVQWSSQDFTEPSGQLIADAASRLAFQRQIEHTLRWLDDPDAEPEWRASAFATQAWMWLTPDELSSLQREVLEVFDRFAGREHEGRAPVLCFAKGFPSQP